MPEYFSSNELLANVYWKDKRLEYSGGDLIYLALNRTLNADINNQNWYIYKFTWVSGDCTRIQGPIEGSWANRINLGW